MCVLSSSPALAGPRSLGFTRATSRHVGAVAENGIIWIDGLRNTYIDKIFIMILLLHLIFTLVGATLVCFELATRVAVHSVVVLTLFFPRCRS